MIRPPPKSTPFPFTTLFRSLQRNAVLGKEHKMDHRQTLISTGEHIYAVRKLGESYTAEENLKAVDLARAAGRGKRSEEHPPTLQSKSHSLSRHLTEKTITNM